MRGVVAATRDGDELLIAGMDRIEAVDARGRVTLVAEVEYRHEGHDRTPSSIVRTPDGTILVSLGLPISRLTPNADGSYTEDWLVPPPCRVTVSDESGMDCTCVGLL